MNKDAVFCFSFSGVHENSGAANKYSSYVICLLM